MATCDSAREREASKELQNLVDTVLEEWEASGKRKPFQEKEQEESGCQAGTNDGDKGVDSMAELLAAEIAEVRQKGKKGTSQNARIINTNVKGMAMVKIVPKDCCPVEIVRHVFQKVKTEKKAYSRHIVRMIPLKFCFFPDEWDLVDNVRKAIRTRFPGIQLPPKFYTMTKEEKERLKVEKQQEKERKKAERVQRRQEEMAREGAVSEPGGNDGGNGVEAGVGDKRSADEASVGVKTDTVTAAAGEDEGVEAAAKRAKTDPTSAPAVMEKEKEKEKEEEEEEEMGGTAVAYPPFSYYVRFKGRNHNTITKELAGQYVRSNMPGPPMATYDRVGAEVSACPCPCP